MPLQYWKVNCMEDEYPGLWHAWFKEQVVAVGWPPGAGFRRDGKGKKRLNWTIARNCLDAMQPGDKVVVQLCDHRVGRIGETVGVPAGDEWNPTVPPSRDEPHGEQGRRVAVRWDLSYGPPVPESVVRLPEKTRLDGAKLRVTVCSLRRSTFDRIAKAMRDDANWISVVPRFNYERSLSDYIAESPRQLEDGLRPYPSAKAREMVFDDGTRLDVLLLDHDGNAVVVECKQGPPRPEHLRQLRRYMRNAQNLKYVNGTGRVRGILVHGGARKLSEGIRRESRRAPRVELVQYDVGVKFSRSE